MKRLFLDIETCPNIGLFWSAGYRVDIPPENILIERRIITAAYKWEGDKKAKAFIWDKNQSDKQLVYDLIEVMNQADEIVAHFGDGFDIPWIRARALYYGIILPEYKTVDTKAWSSKLFYLNSNKLDYIAQYLKVGKKIRTTYDLWKDIVIEKDKNALTEMVMYNIHDVELLQGVYNYLSNYGSLKTHVGVLDGKPKWSCARCGHELVTHIRAMASKRGTISHNMQCRMCKRYNTISHKTYLDLEKHKEENPEYDTRKRTLK